MSAYDQIYKAYTESQKNGFWDAWGIVASSEVISELRAECLEQIVAHKSGQGEFDTIFGLVAIPYNLVEKDKVYIVDEMLGRTILGQTERNK